MCRPVPASCRRSRRSVTSRATCPVGGGGGGQRRSRRRHRRGRGGAGCGGGGRGRRGQGRRRGGGAQGELRAAPTPPRRLLRAFALFAPHSPQLAPSRRQLLPALSLPAHLAASLVAPSPQGTRRRRRREEEEGGRRGRRSSHRRGRAEGARRRQEEEGEAHVREGGEAGRSQGARLRQQVPGRVRAEARAHSAIYTCPRRTMVGRRQRYGPRGRAASRERAHAPEKTKEHAPPGRMVCMSERRPSRAVYRYAGERCIFTQMYLNTRLFNTLGWCWRTRTHAYCDV